jgi:hypothetical protein
MRPISTAVPLRPKTLIGGPVPTETPASYITKQDCLFSSNIIYITRKYYLTLLPFCGMILSILLTHYKKGILMTDKTNASIGRYMKGGRWTDAEILRNPQNEDEQAYADVMNGQRVNQLFNSMGDNRGLKLAFARKLADELRRELPDE